MTLFAFATLGNDSASVLFLCAVLTIALIVFTFYVPADYAHGKKKTRLAFLKERKEQLYENLRDLNFEHKAGKLPDADFQQMRSSLEDEAATLLAEIESLEDAPQPDAVYKGASATMNQSKGARS
jgi:hypothetical protein